MSGQVKNAGDRIASMEAMLQNFRENFRCTCSDCGPSLPASTGTPFQTDNQEKKPSLGEWDWSPWDLHDSKAKIFDEVLHDDGHGLCEENLLEYEEMICQPIEPDKTTKTASTKPEVARARKRNGRLDSYKRL
eukprot:gnl/MRDRNA2_/MRDRNA2_226862_c0_seq1.p1 gnl/MRDRNA2_/MRDRNA2_226862_c0~~gnl/MRDRNA2_/MRDRNA2_226862_c0_seq1.p1  ORF type:complete len:133 (-),score=23.96 gnl/MRDRNA2_/MRDRNA2_226862_c0_seq1:100-498(-)